MKNRWNHSSRSGWAGCLSWRCLGGIALLWLAPAVGRGASGWTELCNGKNLENWVQRGGKATYEVKAGNIVGRCALQTPNSFLCTTRTYGDFILEYDFKVDPRLNSGVQIRSQCLEQATEVEWDGKKVNVPAGRVHGYQVEIDPDVPRKRMWSAGIYDEARRGWLFPRDGLNGPEATAFSQQGLRIFKPQDWNHVRVEAVGDSIKTWLNGTPCADLHDYFTPRGFIGLQVHSVENNPALEGAEVAWRHLRIQEIPPNTLTAAEKAQGWKLLWDGKTTAGWRSAKANRFPKQGWQIKDGEWLVSDAGGADSAGGGDIITKKRYANFELYAEFKVTPGANSGIKYFVQPNLDPSTGVPAKAGSGSAIGLEFQILDDSRHPDAKLGRDGDRTVSSLYDLKPATNKIANAVGEWNSARIISNGRHVEHWLNGRKVLEYERSSPEFRALVAQSKYKKISNFGEWADGHILLQDHGNAVAFRNLKLRELPER